MMTDPGYLLVFLHDQLNKDEAAARRALEQTKSRYVGITWRWSAVDGIWDESYLVLGAPSPEQVIAHVATMRALIHAVLNYEELLDSEWGCGHTLSEIEGGGCTPLIRIPALVSMVQPYYKRDGFEPMWALAVH